MNVFGVSFFMRVMYRENMSGFTDTNLTNTNLDEEIKKVGTINDIDESEETNTSPSPGQIAKDKKLALLQSNLQNEENTVKYIATDGTSIVFSNDSIPDGEKLIIRIMGDLYKFSAKHAHVVASFIFAVGLYKVGTDIKPLLVKFVSFLNTIKPTGTQIVSATKFAFYATTAFSSVLFWMGHSKESIQSNLLDKLDKQYEFKNVGIDNVIFNHTIIGNIPKNITLATVMNDLYTGLACLSKVCTNTIPTIVRNAKKSVYSIASQTFTNIIDMQEAISTIFYNYLEINDYSEDDISTVSGILSQKSTQSILSSESLATIIETTNVASGGDPSRVIDQIIEANDVIVEENVETVARQDLTDMEVILNNNYEPLSQLSDGFNEVEDKSDSDDEYIQYNKKQKTNTDENVGGKSRRKHNKNTHKKRNKKTHKKHNKKTNKKSRKQRRSRKH